MNEDRKTEIIEVELPNIEEEVEIDLREEIKTSDLMSEVELSNMDTIELEKREEFRDELFEQLKIALIDEQRLLKRFYEFCAQYDGFEYDEMGMNMEEGNAILKRADKIRDKFLNSIEEKLLYIFDNLDTNTLTRIVSFDLDAKEFQYKVIIEVFEDSFDLEVK
ncbi:MAG: hypothetical protein DRG78_10450 [Epsilonproteobacteria bacterium]|nr:MAG: hypothetical protein DRG78_10450 [Campylobacterota bacterium]